MRKPDREGFLSALANLALDAYPGQVWFAVDQQTRNKTKGTAVVCEYLQDGRPFHRIGPDTMRAGLNAIRTADVKAVQVKPERWEEVLVNGVGQNLYLSVKQRNKIMDANKGNDITALNTDDALAVLECGLFGQVTYQ